MGGEFVGGLEQAIYDTVHEFVDPARPGHRGAAALAPRLGKSPSVLSNQASPFVPGHKLGLLESVPLQIAAKRFDILHEYAAALGHVAIELPPCDDVSDVALLDQWAEFHQLLGEQAGAIREALRDTRISFNEITRIRTATDAAVRALLGLVHRLEGLAR